MTRARLGTTIFFLLPLIYFVAAPISVADLGYWTAYGRRMLETGQLLHFDPFTVHHGEELVYPVLSCLLYGALYPVLGLVGLSLAHKLVVVAVSALWYRAAFARLRRPWSPTALVLTAFAWCGCLVLTVDRPALLVLPLFLLAFRPLARDRELRDHDLALLVLIDVLWVNLHGSWPLLFLMALWRESARSFARGWRPRRLWPLALPIAALLNPFGWKVFNYVAQTVSTAREVRLGEWAPLNLTTFLPQEVAFYLLLVLSVTAAVSWWKRDRRRFELLILSPLPLLFPLGMHSVRNTIWVFLALLPLAAELKLFKEDPRRDREHPGHLAVAVALGLLLIALLPPIRGAIFPPERRRIFDVSAPLAFAARLNAAGDHEPVFNEWDYGSLLALAQSHPLITDTINVIYDPAARADYLGVVEMKPGWRHTLDELGFRYALLEKAPRTRLIAELRHDGWHALLEDDDTILLERKHGR